METLIQNKTFREIYPGATYKRYTGKEFDVILFDYIYGKTIIFFKSINEDVFKACKGNMGSSQSNNGDYKSTYKAENTLSDLSWQKEIQIYSTNDNACIIAGKTSFDFADRNLDEISELFFEDLPVIDKISYLYKTESGVHFLVTNTKYNPGPNSNKLFVITEAGYVRYDITNIDRYRDGGTTNIFTSDGSVLYSPTPFDKELKATWTNSEEEEFKLEKVEPENAPSFVKSNLIKLKVEFKND